MAVTMEHMLLAYNSLVANEPGLQGIAVFCQVRVEKDLPFLAAVNKSGTILINPDLDKIAKGMLQVKFVLYHELCHVLTDTLARRGTKNPRLWNIASDLYINSMLDKVPFLQRPALGCFPRDMGLPEDLTDEEYYALLLKNPPDDPQDGFSGLDLCEDDDGTEEVIDPKQQALLSASREEALRQIGTSPSAPHMLRAKIMGGTPWQVLFARACASKLAASGGGAVFDGFRRRGKIFEDRIRPAQPRVTVIVDISGSTGDYWEKFAGELQRVFCALQEFRLIACNSVVVHDSQVRTATALQEITWGGGTDMRKAFQVIQPGSSDLVVLLTDGETPWPDMFHTRTVVVVTPGGPMGPSWGTTVMMSK